MESDSLWQLIYSDRVTILDGLAADIMIYILLGSSPYICNPQSHQSVSGGT